MKFMVIYGNLVRDATALQRYLKALDRFDHSPSVHITENKALFKGGKGGMCRDTPSP